MKTIFSILSVSLIFSCANICRASVIFSQDFSAGGTPANYVSSTPNSGQWNAIGVSGSGTTVSIANGALQYIHNGANAGSFTRNTDFSPIPTAISYSFALTVSGVSTTTPITSGAVWGVGSGYGTQNSDPTSTLNNSRFAVGFNTDGTFSLHAVGASATSSFSSGTTLNLTWVINDSGSTLSYLGPDGNTDTVGNGKWDLWTGNTILLDEKSADNAATSLSELKFVFENNAANATITMDNFNISDLTPVPEPAEWGAISGFGLLGICGLRTWRERRSANPVA
jgi:hypothetical protein